MAKLLHLELAMLKQIEEESMDLARVTKEMVKKEQIKMKLRQSSN